MWILTDYAIKHGVQSTTRYRKTGGVKRGTSNRVPAIQRQRSGAKGGRAACRAARLRRQEQNVQSQPATVSSINSPPYPSTTGSATPSHYDYQSAYDYSPATPAYEQPLTSSYMFPCAYTSNVPMELKFEDNDFKVREQQLQECLFPQPSDSAFEEMLRLHMESSTPGIPT